MLPSFDVPAAGFGAWAQATPGHLVTYQPSAPLLHPENGAHPAQPVLHSLPRGADTHRSPGRPSLQPAGSQLRRRRKTKVSCKLRQKKVYMCVCIYIYINRCGTNTVCQPLVYLYIYFYIYKIENFLIFIIT